jgi:hypothetical protein
MDSATVAADYTMRALDRYAEVTKERRRLHFYGGLIQNGHSSAAVERLKLAEGSRSRTPRKSATSQIFFRPSFTA